MNRAGTLGLAADVQAEHYIRNLAPVSAFGVGIKYP